jgi:hypothetical protein
MDLRGSESETKFLLLAGHKNLGKSDPDAVSYQMPRRERRPGARSDGTSERCGNRPRITQILTAHLQGQSKMRIVGVAAILAAAMAVEAGRADARPFAKTPQFAVGAQYGSTHVYVAAEDMDRFTASFLRPSAEKARSPGSSPSRRRRAALLGRRSQHR